MKTTAFVIKEVVIQPLLKHGNILVLTRMLITQDLAEELIVFVPVYQWNDHQVIKQLYLEKNGHLPNQPTSLI
jgi:hypothetical protein